jgi:hypothetical protein
MSAGCVAREVSFDEFRREMRAFWRRAHSRERDLRSPRLARVQLQALYLRLGERERALAARVLCEWTHSDEPAKRSDAHAVVRGLHIDCDEVSRE